MVYTIKRLHVKKPKRVSSLMELMNVVWIFVLVGNIIIIAIVQSSSPSRLRRYQKVGSSKIKYPLSDSLTTWKPKVYRKINPEQRSLISQTSVLSGIRNRQEPFVNSVQISDKTKLNSKAVKLLAVKNKKSNSNKYIHSNIINYLPQIIPFSFSSSQSDKEEKEDNLKQMSREYLNVDNNFKTQSKDLRTHEINQNYNFAISDNFSVESTENNNNLKLKEKCPSLDHVKCFLKSMKNNNQTGMNRYKRDVMNTRSTPEEKHSKERKIIRKPMKKIQHLIKSIVVNSSEPYSAMVENYRLSKAATNGSEYIPSQIIDHLTGTEDDDRNETKQSHKPENIKEEKHSTSSVQENNKSNTRISHNITKPVEEIRERNETLNTYPHLAMNAILFSKQPITTDMSTEKVDIFTKERTGIESSIPESATIVLQHAGTEENDKVATQSSLKSGIEILVGDEKTEHNIPNKMFTRSVHLSPQNKSNNNPREVENNSQYLSDNSTTARTFSTPSMPLNSFESNNKSKEKELGYSSKSITANTFQPSEKIQTEILPNERNYTSDDGISSDFVLCWVETTNVTVYKPNGTKEIVKKFKVILDGPEKEDSENLKTESSEANVPHVIEPTMDKEDELFKNLKKHVIYNTLFNTLNITVIEKVTKYCGIGQDIEITINNFVSKITKKNRRRLVINLFTLQNNSSSEEKKRLAMGMEQIAFVNKKLKNYCTKEIHQSLESENKSQNTLPFNTILRTELNLNDTSNVNNSTTEKQYTSNENLTPESLVAYKSSSFGDVINDYVSNYSTPSDKEDISFGITIAENITSKSIFNEALKKTYSSKVSPEHENSIVNSFIKLLSTKFSQIKSDDPSIISIKLVSILNDTIRTIISEVIQNSLLENKSSAQLQTINENYHETQGILFEDMKKIIESNIVICNRNTVRYPANDWSQILNKDNCSQVKNHFITRNAATIPVYTSHSTEKSPDSIFSDNLPEFGLDTTSSPFRNYFQSEITPPATMYPNQDSTRQEYVQDSKIDEVHYDMPTSVFSPQESEEYTNNDSKHFVTELYISMPTQSYDKEGTDMTNKERVMPTIDETQLVNPTTISRIYDDSTKKYQGKFEDDTFFITLQPTQASKNKDRILESSTESSFLPKPEMYFNIHATTTSSSNVGNSQYSFSDSFERESSTTLLQESRMSDSTVLNTAKMETFTPVMSEPYPESINAKIEQITMSSHNQDDQDVHVKNLYSTTGVESTRRHNQGSLRPENHMTDSHHIYNEQQSTEYAELENSSIHNGERQTTSSTHLERYQTEDMLKEHHFKVEPTSHRTTNFTLSADNSYKNDFNSKYFGNGEFLRSTNLPTQSSQISQASEPYFFDSSVSEKPSTVSLNTFSRQLDVSDSSTPLRSSTGTSTSTLLPPGENYDKNFDKQNQSGLIESSIKPQNSWENIQTSTEESRNNLMPQKRENKLKKMEGYEESTKSKEYSQPVTIHSNTMIPEITLPQWPQDWHKMTTDGESKNTQRNFHFNRTFLPEFEEFSKYSRHAYNTESFINTKFPTDESSGTSKIYSAEILTPTENDQISPSSTTIGDEQLLRTTTSPISEVMTMAQTGPITQTYPPNYQDAIILTDTSKPINSRHVDDFIPTTETFNRNDKDTLLPDSDVKTELNHKSNMEEYKYSARTIPFPLYHSLAPQTHKIIFDQPSSIKNHDTSRTNSDFINEQFVTTFSPSKEYKRKQLIDEIKSSPEKLYNNTYLAPTKNPATESGTSLSHTKFMLDTTESMNETGISTQEPNSKLHSVSLTKEYRTERSPLFQYTNPLEILTSDDSKKTEKISTAVYPQEQLVPSYSAQMESDIGNAKGPIISSQQQKEFNGYGENSMFSTPRFLVPPLKTDNHERDDINFMNAPATIRKDDFFTQGNQEATVQYSSENYDMHTVTQPISKLTDNNSEQRDSQGIYNTQHYVQQEMSKETEGTPQSTASLLIENETKSLGEKKNGISLFPDNVSYNEATQNKESTRRDNAEVTRQSIGTNSASTEKLLSEFPNPKEMEYMKHVGYIPTMENILTTEVTDIEYIKVHHIVLETSTRNEYNLLYYMTRFDPREMQNILLSRTTERTLQSVAGNNIIQNHVSSFQTTSSSSSEYKLDTNRRKSLLSLKMNPSQQPTYFNEEYSTRNPIVLPKLGSISLRQLPIPPDFNKRSISSKNQHITHEDMHTLHINNTKCEPNNRICMENKNKLKTLPSYSFDVEESGRRELKSDCNLDETNLPCISKSSQKRDIQSEVNTEQLLLVQPLSIKCNKNIGELCRQQIREPSTKISFPEHLLQIPPPPLEDVIQNPRLMENWHKNMYENTDDYMSTRTEIPTGRVRGLYDNPTIDRSIPILSNNEKSSFMSPPQGILRSRKFLNPFQYLSSHIPQNPYEIYRRYILNQLKFSSDLQNPFYRNAYGMFYPIPMSRNKYFNIYSQFNPLNYKRRK